VTLPFGIHMRGGKPVHRRISRSATILAVTAIVALGVPLGLAFARHQFTDVPSSHLFHADIDAINDAGVTTGCATNPPRYCPSSFVTRGEMAAFMNRLGALGPGKPPKVNADKVDGFDANELVRGTGASGTEALVAITATAPTFQNALTITVTAPKAGFVLVTASSGAENTTATCAVFDCGVQFRLRHVQGAAQSPAVAVSVHGAVTPRNTASVTQAFPVGAGTQTFNLQVARVTASQSPSYFSPQMTGIYVPFGSTGGSTLGE
jgi:hypothetical protein